MTRYPAKTLPKASEVQNDKRNYHAQKIQGYYNYDCHFPDGRVRSAKFYLPKDSRYNQPTIFLFCPANSDPYAFFEQTGWKTLADREKLSMILLEPGESGQWRKLEDELTYINEVYEDISFRPFFVAYKYNFYAVAYGRETGLLSAHLARFPHHWAGVALLGAEEEDLLPIVKREEGDPILDLPLWLAPTQDALPGDFLQAWKLAFAYEKEEKTDTGYVFSYTRKATVDAFPTAKLVVDLASKGDFNEAYLQKLYRDFLYGNYRYPGYGQGAFRSYPSIFTRGFQRFTGLVPGGYRDSEEDLYSREWFVYAPEDRKDPLPVVFLFHGAGGCGEEIADRTGWADLAKRQGILLVCPTASCPNRVRQVSNMETNEIFRPMWNTGAATEDRPSDLVFLDYLMDWVLEHYSVDPSRIYGTGQSSGGMMSWACATYRPDYFAAVGPNSARTPNIESEPLEPVVASPVAIISSMGAEDRAFPNSYATEDAKELINYWSGRYHLDGDWGTFRFMDLDAKATSREGNVKHYVFKDPEGLPMLQLMEVFGKKHAYLPSEAIYFWEHCFQCFRKDAKTKKLLFQGKAAR